MSHEVIFWTTGTLAGRTTEQDLVPAGAILTTQAGYDAFVAAQQPTVDAVLADQQAAAQAAAEQDYLALIAAGVAAETASRLTGFRPA